MTRDSWYGTNEPLKGLVLQGGEAARVLVIEDDAVVRRLLTIALGREGYDVLEASDGMEGMKLCESGNVDLVITDIMMPLMDGLEVIARLKRSYQQTRIIAISGGLICGGIDLLSEAKRLGADTCISKPFDIHRIVRLAGLLTTGQPHGGRLQEAPPMATDIKGTALS